MMQLWGHTHVSSAHEVYLVLSRAASSLEDSKAWEDLLCIEPPIWGSAAAHASAMLLAAIGYRVWSWDELGIVYSYPDAVPPRSLRYLSWTAVEQARVQHDKPP